MILYAVYIPDAMSGGAGASVTFGPSGLSKICFECDSSGIAPFASRTFDAVLPGNPIGTVIRPFGFTKVAGCCPCPPDAVIGGYDLQHMPNVHNRFQTESVAWTEP